MYIQNKDNDKHYSKKFYHLKTILIVVFIILEEN